MTLIEFLTQKFYWGKYGKKIPKSHILHSANPSQERHLSLSLSSISYVAIKRPDPFTRHPKLTRQWQHTLVVTLPLSFNPEHNNLTERHKMRAFYLFVSNCKLLWIFDGLGNVWPEIWYMS